MGDRYCAINSPLGPRWGQKSLDLRSRDFCPHLEPRGELIAQYRPPMSFRYSPTALMKQLGWQSLENRRYHQRMTMMYNISHGLMAVPPTELVKPQRSTRGHHFKYQTIGTNNNRSKYSFYPRSIPERNSLNSDIVTARSVESFKSRLSKLNR